MNDTQDRLQLLLDLQKELDSLPKVDNPSYEHGGVIRYLVQTGITHIDKNGVAHGVHDLTIPPEMLAEMIQAIGAKASVEDMEEWIQRVIHAVISELMEMLRHLRFKWWSDKVCFEPQKLREEFVDVIHFILSLALHLGFNAEELLEEYQKKHRENQERAEGAY